MNNNPTTISSTALVVQRTPPVETKTSQSHSKLLRAGFFCLGLVLLAGAGGMGYVTHLARLDWNEKYSHMSAEQKEDANHNYELGDWGTVLAACTAGGLFLCAMYSVMKSFRFCRQSPSPPIDRLPPVISSIPSRESVVINMVDVNTEEKPARLTLRH